MTCHRLCELIGGPCSLATQRSRGCRPNLTARSVAPAIYDEIRGLLLDGQPRDRDAAVRLAAIFRRELLDDRNLITHARDDEPDLAGALADLCARRPDPS